MTPLAWRQRESLLVKSLAEEAAPAHESYDYDEPAMDDYDMPMEQAPVDVKMEDEAPSAVSRSGGFAPTAKEDKMSGLKAISEQVCTPGPVKL